MFKRDAARPRLSVHSTLHTNNLAQGVDDLHQVLLRFHDGVDGLVSSRGLVNHLSVFAAFHSRSRRLVVSKTEALLCFRARHRTPRSVTAAHEALRVSFAAYDERLRSHRSRDDTHITLASAHGALSGHQLVFAKVVLPRNIVVAVHHL